MDRAATDAHSLHYCSPGGACLGSQSVHCEGCAAIFDVFCGPLHSFIDLVRYETDVGQAFHLRVKFGSRCSWHRWRQIRMPLSTGEFPEALLYPLVARRGSTQPNARVFTHVLG